MKHPYEPAQLIKAVINLFRSVQKHKYRCGLISEMKFEKCPIKTKSLCNIAWKCES